MSACCSLLVGGLIFTKLFSRLLVNESMHPNSLLLCIGTALRINLTQSTIQRFWAESSFIEDPKRHAAMRAIHTAQPASHKPAAEDDQSWRQCVRFSGFASGTADSGLFTTAAEQQRLFHAPVFTYDQRQAQRPSLPSSPPAHYIFFHQGPDDEPFPAEECIHDVLRGCESGLTPRRDLVSERLTLMPESSHFAYFITQKKGGSLEQLIAHLKTTIEKYGERDLLRRYQASAATRPRALAGGLTAAPTSASAPSSTSPASSSSSSSASSSFSPRRVVIIGSGVFGVSTARALGMRYPLAQILLLEKSNQYPPPNGASQDVNRIVRPDYGSDHLYTQWALDSIRGWHEFNQRHCEEVYRHTGVVFLTGPESMKPPSQPDQPMSYEYASYSTLQAPPFSLPLMPLQPLATATASATPASSSSVLQRHFPYWHASQPHLHHGYFNPHAGQVNAARAIALTIGELQATNPRFELRIGAEVRKIETEIEPCGPSAASVTPLATHRRRCIGVSLTSGEFISADLVIAASGVWTTHLIPELKTAVWPSPQPLFYVRPNHDATSDNTRWTTVHTNGTNGTTASPYTIYQDAPAQKIDTAELSIPERSALTIVPSTSFGSPTSGVLSSTPFPVFSFDLSRLGWYGFSADAHGLVKIGHHGPGLASHMATGPDARRVLHADQLHAFTQFLREYMPHLYEHGELVDARTCFYADTFDGHWLLDYQPDVAGLFVATGGSGHAFKFMPIIGDVIGECTSSHQTRAHICRSSH
jgi:sarcosine oxidase/L-pipecolate oxidase